MEQCPAQRVIMTHEPIKTENDARLQQFERFEREAKQPPWVFPLRKAGISCFAEKGFPTLRDEDWRFTNVTPIVKLPFKPVFDASPNGLSSETISEMTFGRLPTARLVFVNGHFHPKLSSTGKLPGGAILTGLAAALSSNSVPGIEKHLAHYARGDDNAFTALNTAFFQDGGLIWIPAGVQVEAPIHLLFIATAKETGATFHPRNLIVAEKGSQATVLESYVATVDSPYFTNAVT